MTNRSILRQDFGVNVAGLLTAQVGVGEAARGYISSIRQLGLPLALNDYAIGTNSRIDPALVTEVSDSNPFPVNIICVNAKELKGFIKYVSLRYVLDKYNIGVWWWELPEFPKRFRRRARCLDEVWVGTNFIRDSLQQAINRPVKTIPPVVLPPNPEMPAKPHFGIETDEFVFLFIFDYFSVVERKNPLAVIDAFRRAFRPEEPIRLVIKSINSSSAIDYHKILKEAAQGARISLLDDYLSASNKNRLLATCDCYISLHRSEGFGYTMAEAMLHGKPVIATNWSGNTDFMSNDNSYPVNYQLTQLKENYGPYKAGQHWAEPDIDHAAKLMRHVYLDREDAQRKGAKARDDIRRAHSPEAVGKAIEKELISLQASGELRPRGPIRKLLQRIALVAGGC